MKKHLLPEVGSFYKANLHCHSTLSDGRMTPQELKEHYKGMGYSVLAITDHDILVPHPELNDEHFLTLNGYEMEVNEETDKPWHNDVSVSFRVIPCHWHAGCHLISITCCATRCK